MPHIIIEYSSNVAQHHDIDAMLDAVHSATLALDVAPVPGVRIRAIEQTRYRIADGSDENHAYVAIMVRVGPGRDPKTKERVIEAILDAAEGSLAEDASPMVIAWSCEVQEIDAEFRVNRNRIAAQMIENS